MKSATVFDSYSTIFNYVAWNDSLLFRATELGERSGEWIMVFTKLHAAERKSKFDVKSTSFFFFFFFSLSTSCLYFLHPSSFSFPCPLCCSPSPPRHRASALRIQSLVNFACPHLRLIDSNRLAVAKLSNLTRGRAAACRGVNARETRFQGKHRVGYSLSLTLSPRDFFLLPATLYRYLERFIDPRSTTNIFLLLPRPRSSRFKLQIYTRDF